MKAPQLTKAAGCFVQLISLGVMFVALGLFMQRFWIWALILAVAGVYGFVWGHQPALKKRD